MKAGVFLKIVFRVISAALALCVIPAAFFLDLLRVRVSVTLLPKAIQDDISIKRIYDLLAPGGSFSGLFSGKGNLLADATVKSLMPAGICFASFFVLALLLSLVIFFSAVFSKKQLVITCLGAGGLVSVIAAYISFGRLVAPILSGAVSISDFVNIGALGLLVDSAIKFQMLRLTSATFVMGLVFAAIAIWGIAYIVTDENFGKKPVKKIKKIKAAN
jgi:hypothetical protein